jgi:MFS family permease
MHIFVPALPIAAKNLGAGMGAMQMTVSLYIFGLAVGQLLYGPMADRFGRRPVLLFGLASIRRRGSLPRSRPTCIRSSPRGCSRRSAAAPASCWAAASCATRPGRRKPRAASR